MTICTSAENTEKQNTHTHTHTHTHTRTHTHNLDMVKKLTVKTKQNLEILNFKIMASTKP